VFDSLDLSLTTLIILVKSFLDFMTLGLTGFGGSL
jgi:hypothetical protein